MPDIVANSDVPIRRSEELLCGRLVALPTSHTMTDLEDVWNQRGLKNNIISIDFPAMPDTIELARTTDYYMNPNLVMPDGIHQYKATKPLEIPVSFKLHAMDSQYCKTGALTLLQLAARLHSFVLPISTFRGAYKIAPKAEDPNPTTGQTNVGQMEAKSVQYNRFDVTGGEGSSRQGAIYPPVACWLHLMWTAEQQPGISCIGYVREVKVQFNGPWLRGPSKSFNLPTSADFSFVFVHRPGHHNNLAAQINSTFPSTNGISSQAFADDVRKNLYNTRHLISAFEYQGFNSSVPDKAEPEPEQTPAQEPPEPTPQNETPIPPNEQFVPFVPYFDPT